MLLLLFAQFLLVPAFILHAHAVVPLTRKNEGHITFTRKLLALKYSPGSLKHQNLISNIDFSHKESKTKLSAQTQDPASRSIYFHRNNSFQWRDNLDKNISRLLLPAILNYALFPVSSAVDTYWVGKLGNALALSGQGAANQVYNSVFWFLSILPNVVTPLISKDNGANDKMSLQRHITEAYFVASLSGIVGTLLLSLNTNAMLSLVLPITAKSRSFAQPYLFSRSLAVLPALLSNVGFAIFRGTLDANTPLQISLISNLFNMILDPLLIFRAKLGVIGVAVASTITDWTSSFLYAKQLLDRRLLPKWERKNIPSFGSMRPLLFGGAMMQIRSLVINGAMIAVSRKVQQIDTTVGSIPAAHAISMQLFHLGSVVSLAMGSVASIILPLVLGRGGQKEHLTENDELISTMNGNISTELQDKIKAEYNALLAAKRASDRILLWSVVLGGSLCVGQFLAAPFLIKLFTPLEHVHTLARIPSIICAFLQFSNCILWTGEGLQQGHSAYWELMLSSIVGACGMLATVQFFLSNPSFSLNESQRLTSIWFSFVVFSLIRLIATILHHFLWGPLSWRRINSHPGQHAVSNENF